MKVFLYDTTLRDGTQGEGISFSADDKLRVAKRLDEFGIDYIEGGWPGSNPKDLEFFERANSELKLKHAKITAFGSTCRANINPEDDPQMKLLIKANTSVVTIFGKSWDFHVTDVLGTTLDENLRMIRESVRFLCSYGREVIYDAEHFFDGYRSNPEYALTTLHAAISGGASTIVLCDTNGGSLPWQICEVVEVVRKTVISGCTLNAPQLSSSVMLGIHAHNDSETGVANTLIAVRYGANHVQGTINGYGERCGNANLVSIIADLQLKMYYNVIPPESLGHLVEVSRYISELANLNPDSHQPFVGASAFAHKGGTHVNAIAKNVYSYQHINPALIGNQTRVLVSELSGKDNIAIKSKEFGLNGLSRDEEKQVLQKIKEMENIGFTFESAEASVELMLRRVHKKYRAPFELIDYSAHIEHRSGQNLFSEAKVKVKVGSQTFYEISEGNGPVNALDQALRKALLQVFPQIERIGISDYKVRILDSTRGSDAIVRVMITTSDGTKSWCTVGASSNTVEASWIALADSMEYFLVSCSEQYQNHSDVMAMPKDSALMLVPR